MIILTQLFYLALALGLSLGCELLLGPLRRLTGGQAPAPSALAWPVALRTLLALGGSLLLLGGPDFLLRPSVFSALTLAGLSLWLGVLHLCYRLCPQIAAQRSRRALALGLIALFALGLECFFFNSPWFITREYQSQSIWEHLDTSTLEHTADGGILVREDTDLGFFDLDCEVKSLRLNYRYNQPGNGRTSFCRVEVSVLDEGWRSTYSLGEVLLCADLPITNDFSLNASGKVSQLYLHFRGYGGESTESIVDYTLTDVVCNARAAFHWSWVRVGLLLICLCFVWHIRPTSCLWQEEYLERRSHRRPLVAFVAAVLAAGSLFLAVFLPHHDNVTMAFPGFNEDKRDAGQLITFYNDPDGSPNTQYNALALSLLEGHFYLDYEVPQALLDLEHPYNTKDRENAGVNQHWDHAYYNGHYYVYFGIVPVLLFQLPWALLTGRSNLSLSVDILVCALALIWGVFVLVRRMAQHWFPKMSTASYLVGCLGFLFLSNAPYLIRNPTIYYVPILCGLMFTVWGLAHWLAALEAKTHRQACLRLGLGSLCMALVAGCRPQMLLGSVLALPLFLRPYWTEKRLFSRQGVQQALCFAVPYLLVAAGLMYYNLARFGSPFDFGANYNLTTNDMTMRGFSGALLWLGIFYLLLQPPTISASFPFLQPSLFSTQYLGLTIQESVFGGLFTCNALAWPGAMLLGQECRQALHRRRLGLFVGLCLSFCVVLAALDSEMAGIVQRYLGDFGVFLALALLPLLLLTEEATRSRHSAPFRKALLCLFSLNSLYQLLLILGADVTLLDHEPLLFLQLMHGAMFWL